MQLSLPAVRSNCSHRISSRVPPLQGTKALPSSRAGTANRVSKRPINFVQAAVGRSHVSDARKGQFLGPSIRVRGKGVFASPAHFRGRSGDHFDTPLLHGPAKLRGMSLANLATGPQRRPVMTSTIAVEGAREFLVTDHFPDTPKAAARAFLFNKTQVVVLVGGVIPS